MPFILLPDAQTLDKFLLIVLG